MKIPHGGRLMIVPAVAQQDAYGIVPGLQIGGDVIRNIKIAPVESGIHWNLNG